MIWKTVSCDCPCHSGGWPCTDGCSCGMRLCGLGTLANTIQEVESPRFNRSFGGEEPVKRHGRKVIILNDRDGSIMAALKKKLG